MLPEGIPSEYKEFPFCNTWLPYFFSYEMGVFPAKILSKIYICFVRPVWQHTFVSPSAFSRRAVVSYWRKYVQEVLVNGLGGLSLPSKSVVRLTDSPDMTLDVYCGRKTTTTTPTVL